MSRTPIKTARRLRQDSTDAEQRLWYHLRDNRLAGAKFRRQQPMGRYVVDFVCHEAKLIVELDGGQHAEQEHADGIRTNWLESEGYRVIRFWNNDTLTNTEGVLTEIAKYLSPSPRPSPIKGEGEPRHDTPLSPSGRGAGGEGDSA